MTNPTDDLARQLGQQLLTCGARVTTAESCTGGGIAEAITAIPGASAWFDYGFVTYSNQAKQHLLGVPPELLRAYGAVSREVVCAMATGAAKMASARFSVAVSGIAGPGGGTVEKPVGTVWLAWSCPSEVASAHHVFAGDRDQVRLQATMAALQGLIKLTSQYCIYKQ